MVKIRMLVCLTPRCDGNLGSDDIRTFRVDEGKSEVISTRLVS